ncbi:hypothetical protein Ssi03_21280 [Sphaerisporangium siamense]|uniref:Anti-sigma regulatory factor (Ser/Thr protein kinase) n=1 Tax=Sphaerisporangium siamense TaxID=795645 RepID=A0A7W7GB00_9ACTN|nr:ATP-binding protein [Sphaerisporangium siamense]MBB4701949.1 anti-sigma regulatory factor (Ser/Thr protein kinase) [Sphaerisporangium siamense]GII84138.1 hypothetical protein Ssi03_21280 [Sphaerisporangium siamense]
MVINVEIRSFRLDMPAQPKAVSRTRAPLREMIHTWAPGHVIDDLIVCASEAVTNAITHAHHDAKLPVNVTRNETRIRIEVTDNDRRPPILTVPPELILTGARIPGRLLEEHGRGLFLIDALSSRWGVRSCPEGKIVWFERDLDSRRPQASGDR